MRILYCTDRAPDAYLVKALREHQHTVEVAPSIDDGLSSAADSDWRAVVCDLQVARPEIVRTVSVATPAAWLLVIAAEPTKGGAAPILRAGADALYVRPYAFLEFAARLDALSRYSVTASAPEGGGVQVELSASDRAVWLDGDRIELGRRQFALLDYLAGQPGAVVPVEAILDAVWADLSTPSAALVHSTVSKLRARLERGRSLKLLHGQRGVGYSFRPDAARSPAKPT